jgi:hypothetical protein
MRIVTAFLFNQYILFPRKKKDSYPTWSLGGEKKIYYFLLAKR